MSLKGQTAELKIKTVTDDGDCNNTSNTKPPKGRRSLKSKKPDKNEMDGSMNKKIIDPVDLIFEGKQ